MVADLRIGCIDFGYISTLPRTRNLILEVRTEVQGLRCFYLSRSDIIVRLCDIEAYRSCN